MFHFQNSLRMTTAMGLLIAAGLAAPALAQEPAELATITISGDAQAQGAGDNATSVDMTAENRKGGTRKLDETLREVPGVFTRVNAGQPGVAVNIRGFEGSGRVNTTIDGVRQSFRFTSHEASGFTYVDQNLLAGIDVTRGADLGAGGGGLAGSVNFRTLEADDVLATGKTRGSLIRFGYGDNGSDHSEMIATAMRGESLDIVGALSKRNAKSYSNGDGDVVANSGQDLTSGLFKATWHIDPRQSLQLGVTHYDNDFFANSYFQTVKSNIFTAKYRYDAGDGLIDFRLNAHYSDLKMTYTGGGSPMAGSVGREIKDRGWGFDASNVSTFAVGGGSLRSTNGVEVFRDDVTSKKGGVNPTDGKVTTSALFSENVWTLGQLEISGGARLQSYKVEGTAQTGAATERVDNSDTSFDPKLTVAYSVLDGVQPYLTWQRTMRAPTPQETMLGGVHPGGTVAGMVPNPNLKAETSQGWELGVNLDRADVFASGDRLRGRVAAWWMDVDDYIVAASNVSRSYWYMNVDGTSKTRGVELELGYDIARYSFGLGYSKSDSDLPSQMPGLGSGQTLPDETVTLYASARFLDDALTVGGTVNHVSSGQISGYNADWSGGAHEKGGDDYNLVDLFASWRATENLDLNLRVSNLFDEQYTPFLSTSGDGQGRTIYLGGQLRF
ncbi:TonB-dependent receptor domain-containing protein [Paenirhodobacter sp.]|uniref:TonB-dependent receptor domain-containing protein n=1 Tax=Paenirhodobacter sp. TaxID=1965326 RepID=UPI003B3FCD95